MSAPYGTQHFTPAERRAFKQLIRPHLEAGLTHREIAEKLNSEGHTLPGGRPVTKSCVALYAVKVLRRHRKSKKWQKPGESAPAGVGRSFQNRRSPKSVLPVTGRLGLVSEILTLPGLSESKRIELIRALVGGAS